MERVEKLQRGEIIDHTDIQIKKDRYYLSILEVDEINVLNPKKMLKKYHFAFGKKNKHFPPPLEKIFDTYSEAQEEYVSSIKRLAEAYASKIKVSKLLNKKNAKAKNE